MRGVDSEAAKTGTERKKEELNTKGMWVPVLFKNIQTEKKATGICKLSCAYVCTHVERCTEDDIEILTMHLREVGWGTGREMVPSSTYYLTCYREQPLL